MKNRHRNISTKEKKSQVERMLRDEDEDVVGKKQSESAKEKKSARKWTLSKTS